jgi:hypothetical protein
VTLVRLDGGMLDGAEVNLFAPTLPRVLRFAPINADDMQGIIEVAGRPWFLVGADFDDAWPEQQTYWLAHTILAGAVIYRPEP